MAYQDYLEGNELTIREYEEFRGNDAAVVSHPRRVNTADHQICCRTCHTCGNALREVCDGELWCSHCEEYR